MIKTRRLVVVDQNRETAEVLKAVLDRGSTEVTSVRNWGQLHQIPSADTPTVLVVHDTAEMHEHPQADQYDQLPRVTIGRAKINAMPSSNQAQHLNDVFEFPELLEAIETLWDHSAKSNAAA